MTIENVIPALWAARFLENLNNEHVYASCFNRDYEGQIKEMGSSVKIANIGNVTIYNYVRNQDLSGPDIPQDAGQILTIDQGKYFHFNVDDLDKRQAQPNIMAAQMTQAAWDMRDVVDLYLGTLLQNGVATAQQLGSIAIDQNPTSGQFTAYDNLVNMDVQLSTTNTPRAGRWAVVPPWYEGFLRKDLRFVGYGTPENRQALTGGKPIGTASGFDVYVSNNVPKSGSAYTVIAGYNGAATYAEQVTETEAYRPQKRFGDAMKMLLVYGAKITRPSNLCSAVCTAGTN